MGVTDPRKLAVILLDLEDEMERWSAAASNILQSSRFTQNLAREQVDITRRRARLTTEEFIETELIQRARKENVTDLNHKSNEAVEATHILVQEAEKKQREVAAVLAHWEGELRKAQAWQSRAEDRLHRAEAELAAAERALAAAEHDLRSAEAALRNCQNTRYEERDNQGRVVRVRHADCSGYAAAVSRARTVVMQAQARVDVARAEVQSARAEVARARARVNSCSEAVNYAKQAVEHANLCLDRSKQSQSQALRSLDYAKAAQQSVEQAGDLVEDSRMVVTDMNVMQQKAEDHLGTAQEFLLKSTQAEESAQRYRIIIRSELQYRTEMLYALNVPELGTVSVSPIRAIAAGVTAAAVSASLSASSGGRAASVPKRAKVPTEDPTPKGTWYSVDTVLPVARLPVMDEPDDETRKMLPLDVLREQQKRLAYMVPQLREGAVENAAFWATQDTDQKLPEKTGYFSTYNTYRGKDPIVVVQLDDGSYWVKSGKTRVWLAQQDNIEALPVRLMKRPDYLVPRRLTTPEGQNWEMRAYEGENSFKLRIYNTSQRVAIPDFITDGDGVCLDAIVETFGKDRTFTIQRFDYSPDDQKNGFVAEALQWSEELCLAQGIATCSLTLPIERVTNTADRDWYVARGYAINREGRNALIYKKVQK